MPLAVGSDQQNDHDHHCKRSGFEDDVPRMSRPPDDDRGNEDPEQAQPHSARVDEESQLERVRPLPVLVRPPLGQVVGSEVVLTESEEHVDWLETQLHLIETVGVQNYLTEQMGKADDEEGG